MVRQAALVLILAACNNPRNVEVCIISTADNKAFCAKDDKRFERPLPELNRYFAMPEVDARKVFDKIEACERAEKPTPLSESELTE